MKPVLSAALAIAVFGASAHAQSAASVGGVMVSRDNRTPVEGARIEVLGTGRVVASDAHGRFTFTDLPAGVRVIQARAIGFAVASWLLELREGQSYQDTFDLEPRIFALEAVTVRAEPADWRSEAGFERRRLRGGGVFLTREDIQRQRPATLADLMRSVPGLLLSCRGGSGVNNCNIQMSRSTRICSPQYFLDGHPATNATGPNFPMGGVDIRGVEVYRTQFEVPVEFQRFDLRCGVIAIWSIQPGERFDEPRRP